MIVAAFIHDLEANKMSFNRSADKQSAVHPDNGKLLSNKRNELSNHKKTWKNLKCTLTSERSHCKKTTYSVILAV